MLIYFRGKTVGWISAKVPDKIRRDKKALMSMPEMKDHTTHSELLNQCMDALKRTFDVSEGEDNNNSLHGNHSHKNTMGALKSRPDYKMMEGSAATISNALGRSLANSANDDPNISKLLKVRVLHGYAVRYLHIPGIKVVSPMTGLVLKTS
jgi:non-homologous end joining protein Ku